MTAIDPKLRKALTGISGILVTPFDAQDKVAPARLKPIVLSGPASTSWSRTAIPASSMA